MSDSLSVDNTAGAILSRFIAAEPEAAHRALLELYALQTADERAQRKTTVRNGKGFGARYAVRASHLAEAVLRGDALSTCDLDFVHNVVNVHRDLSAMAVLVMRPNCSPPATLSGGMQRVALAATQVQSQRPSSPQYPQTCTWQRSR